MFLLRFELVDATDNVGLFELAAPGTGLLADDAHHGDGEAPSRA